MAGKKENNLLFVLGCLIALALGSLLRMEPWQVSQPDPSVAEGTAGSEAGVVQNTPKVVFPEEMAKVLLAFYDAVDRGHYDEAYDMAFENSWRPLPDGNYTHAGLTSRPDFVEGLNLELEPNGVNLAIFAIRLIGLEELVVPTDPQMEPLELAILPHLPDGLSVSKLYRVELEGWLGDACTPGAWHNWAVMAQMSDGGWRVLLPGGPRPENKRRSEWFTDVNAFEGRLLIDGEVKS